MLLIVAFPGNKSPIGVGKAVNDALMMYVGFLEILNEIICIVKELHRTMMVIKHMKKLRTLK